MPFDLRIHYRPDGVHDTWSMEAPWWLDAATPPNAELIREETNDYWMRDRYLEITAGELRDWHSRVFSSIGARAGGRDALSNHDKAALRRFEKGTGKASDTAIYLLHWYEWNSGYN